MRRFDPLPFVGVEELEGRPHLVVDGAARPGTLLCLSHWPGSEAPAALRRDLSVEMAFAYLERPRVWRRDAMAVTNDHLDEDGLASLFALTNPDEAVELERRLVAFGRLGDFDVAEDEETLHAVLATRALLDPARGDLLGSAPGERPGALSRTARGYHELLGRLRELLLHPERHRDLYEEDLARIEVSRAALAAGAAEIEEITPLDLAVVRVHRAPAAASSFGHGHELPLDPIALHSATRCTRVALVAPGRLSYHDRYESWVIYRSRPLPRRRDLTRLVARLDEEEGGSGAHWRADPPSALVAVLDHDQTSQLAPERFVALVVEHLERSPAAFDPMAPRPARRAS